MHTYKNSNVSSDCWDRQSTNPVWGTQNLAVKQMTLVLGLKRLAWQRQGGRKFTESKVERALGGPARAGGAGPTMTNWVQQELRHLQQLSRSLHFSSPWPKVMATTVFSAKEELNKVPPLGLLGVTLSQLLFREKAVAPHSSTLSWKIPRTEEPGRLQSMGSQRVGHDWATSLSLFTFTHWRRKWQPTPVFLPGKSQGRGSLVGCRLWGRTESDTTEET